MSAPDPFDLALQKLIDSKPAARKSKAATLLDPYRENILKALAKKHPANSIAKAYNDAHPEAKLSNEAVRRYIETLRKPKTSAYASGKPGTDTSKP